MRIRSFAAIPVLYVLLASAASAQSVPEGPVFDGLPSDAGMWAGLEGIPGLAPMVVYGGPREGVVSPSSLLALERLMDRMEPAARSLPTELPVVDARITSNVGVRRNPVTRRHRVHEGTDFAAPSGTPVRATGGAVVTQAGWQSAYGKVVVLDHGAGITTLYAHLRSFEVAVGDVVERGQQIGEIGTTGRSTGPHLHYECRIDGAVVDPLDPLLHLDGLRGAPLVPPTMVDELQVQVAPMSAAGVRVAGPPSRSEP
jgi:murein DD-endopeptidase MepM/ murein hydrolase activator NlpD